MMTIDIKVNGRDVAVLRITNRSCGLGEEFGELVPYDVVWQSQEAGTDRSMTGTVRIPVERVRDPLEFAAGILDQLDFKRWQAKEVFDPDREREEYIWRGGGV